MRLIKQLAQGEDDDENSDQDEDEDEEMEDSHSMMKKEMEPLPITSGFDWNGDLNMGQGKTQSESESEASDIDVEGASKKNRKKKGNQVEDRTAELATQAPQVAADYERLLLGSPNSSYLWINYMAFQLQLSEIAKARDIGERALKIISFREEQEKMNVWVAMMNLENTFGTADSLDAIFKRAVQVCEPKKVHLQLVKIYERSKKNEVR